MNKTRLLRCVVAALALPWLSSSTTACSGRAATGPTPSSAAEQGPLQVVPSPAGSPAPAQGDAEGPVPLHPDDARTGGAEAEVTIVVATDLQCPFCARADVTLKALEERYGPRLRVVFKHLPLDFHPMATPAALRAMEVQRSHGDVAFFRFVRLVLGDQEHLDAPHLDLWARDATAGLSPVRRTFTAAPLEQLARDAQFAASHGIYGTPHFLVNGRRIAGAQPLSVFVAAVDAELAAIQEARAAGHPTRYADRAAVNYEPPEERGAVAREDPDEGHIFRVPIAGSPVLGPSDALVTLVEFNDFQCPFCKRAQRTLDQLVQKYGRDLRIVFKHHPLDFHDRAGATAGFALEAFRQRGNDAFWTASRSIFEAPLEALTDPGLQSLGRTLKLDPRKVQAAIERGAEDPVIAADMALADALRAPGTPAFFINGQKLVGAQPIQNFEALIDAQLEAARAMVAAGAPRGEVYDRIMKLADGG